MRKFLAVTLVAASLAFSGSAMTPARAGDGGNVAAGILGGLVVGTFIGAAATGPRYYAPPPPPPVYVGPEPASYCYWTRGEPVWDGYRGTWVVPRIRVCE